MTERPGGSALRLRAIIQRLRGMNLSFLESASVWTSIATAALTIAAAIVGVFALYFSQRLGAAKDTELRRFQDAARRDIATADARAEEARLKAALATEGAARATADAAHANERTGELEIQAAAQRERAAKAERELLSLQQGLAPRRLTTEQSAVFIRAARRAEIKGAVQILCVMGDAEGKAFGGQLQGLLEQAGFPKPELGDVSYFPNNPVGFGMLVGDAVPPHAQPLQAAFAAAGLPIPVVRKDGLTPNVVQLVVGSSRPTRPSSAVQASAVRRPSLGFRAGAMRKSARVTPVKRVRVTAFDCVCARCGRQWRALEPPDRCPGCKARNWQRPALWRGPRPHSKKTG